MIAGRLIHERTLTSFSMNLHQLMRGGLFHSIIFFNYKGFYLLNNSINYQSDDTRLFTKDFDVGNLEALEFK